jgi:hypothetical protein
MSDTTQIIEFGRAEDYNIDDCEICEAPVLRPIGAPPLRYRVILSPRGKPVRWPRIGSFL